MAKMKSATRWRDKLERGEAKIVDIPPKWEARFGRGKMLIPKPLDVDAWVRGVKKGRLATFGELRDALGESAGVSAVCPLTTGIFVRIMAEAAEEDRAQGKSRVTPWWRLVKDDGSLQEKCPGGPEAQAEKLREEGHELLPGKGKKPPKAASVAARSKKK